MTTGETNSGRISRTRRRRGYDWEYTITRRFNEADGWKAFRLGSPSVSLPDVLAVNTVESALLVIEAKSGASNLLYVPAEQIEQCRRWVDTFDIYERRSVVLAFKFLAKKNMGAGTYKSRQAREFFKVWDVDIPPVNCSCSYGGVIRLVAEGGNPRIDLADCAMPFEIKGNLP